MENNQFKKGEISCKNILICDISYKILIRSKPLHIYIR